MVLNFFRSNRSIELHLLDEQNNPFAHTLTMKIDNEKNPILFNLNRWLRKRKRRRLQIQNKDPPPQTFKNQISRKRLIGPQK